MFSLAKADGGWQPIGLIAPLIRLLGKIKHDKAKCWEAAKDRPYCFGGAGRSCEDAAWLQSFDADRAKALNLEA
eukprot:2356134-Pyramimonas_sp.AAC.1